jgi:hypothetical protein
LLSSEAGNDVGDLRLPYWQKAVYYYWHLQVQEHWRFCENPFESARNFVENAKDGCVATLNDVQAQPGIQAFGFQVTDFMCEWAPKTQELALDSTCTWFKMLIITHC